MFFLHIVVFRQKGHSFSMYAERGEGAEQKGTPCVLGGVGTEKSMHVCKKSLFAYNL